MGKAINTELEQARNNGSTTRPTHLANEQLRQDSPPAFGLRNRVAGNNGNHAAKPDMKETDSKHLPAETGSEIDPGALPNDELEQLQVENVDLRQRVADLENLFAEASRKALYWEEQHKEQDRILEEKSDVIRELHGKIQELQAQAPVRTPSDEELLSLEEELERERRQLKEDEESLMRQMRDMEVQISRERAELARQRNDLQRLHSEIRHELELTSRQAELRERLQPLQRRYQELSHRKGAEPLRDAGQQNSAPPPTAAEPRTTKESGIFRRLFG